PLSRVLPPGLSLTLVALLHLLLLGLGTHALSRRIGYAHGPALFSGSRAVLLAMLTALSAAGDLPGLVLALAFAGGAAALLGGAARTVPAAKGGLAAGLGVVLGLALVAYRALPRVLGDPAGYVALDLFREGPFWSGGGPLRLPFFLGSITLLALASALAGQRRDRRALL